MEDENANRRFDALLQKMAPPSERKKPTEYLTPEEVVEKFRRMDEEGRRKDGKGESKS